MKKTAPFFLMILFIFLGVYNATAQKEQTDKFILDAFNSLKAKDSLKYKDLFPDYKIFLEITDKMITAKAGGDSADLNKKLKFSELFTKEEYEKNLIAKEVKRFNRIILTTEMAGVSWDNAVFTSYSIDDIQQTSPGIDELRGAILFSSGNNKYKMPFKNIVRYNNVPYGISFRKIFKMVNGKYVDEDGNEEPK